MNLPKSALNLDKFKKGPSNLNPSKATLVQPTNILPKFALIDKRKAKIIDNIDTIPSLPSIIFEITKLANSPKSSASDIENKMKNDQVLTAKILKVANSSYYALQTKATTVTRAVTLLGFSALKSIVVASSCSDTLSKDLSIYGYESEGLWSHSLACATASKEIGKRIFKMNDEQCEELFVAGLIHDIGKIAIAPVLTQIKEDMDRFLESNPNASLEETESSLTGITHAEVGEMLTVKWQLNETLTAAIKSHHQDTNNKTNAIVRLADILSNESQFGIRPDYKWHQKVSAELLTSLGINEEVCLKLKAYLKEFLTKETENLMGALA